MLSRRHLRKRCLQALYAYHQSEHKDLAAVERQVLHGIERTADLLYLLLDVLPELGHLEHVHLAETTKKFLESSRLDRRRTLEQNVLVRLLATDPAFRKSIRARGLSWQDDLDLLRRVFATLRRSPEYLAYVQQDGTPEDELAFAVSAFRTHVTKNESFSQYIEEKNIFWADGFPFASEMAVKILRSVKDGADARLDIPPMYREEADDKAFIHVLLFETVRNDAYFDELVRNKAKNWDLERIALVDIILMKMALTEILGMESIPVKVSINEYLEIAKEFSTPKSRIFINGIIDKLVIDLRSENKIVKTGRGLVE